MSIAHKIFRETKNIRSVQKVRSKLELIHISDVSSADGRKMNEYFLSPQQGKRDRNTYDWSSKHHATNIDLTVWMKLLKHIFQADTYHLSSPLGKWIDMPLLKWIEQWDYFVSNDRQFLYHRI